MIRYWKWLQFLVAAFESLKNIPKSLSLTKWITNVSGWLLIVRSVMEFYFCDSEMVCEFPFTNDLGILLENLKAAPQKTCSKEDPKSLAKKDQEITHLSGSGGRRTFHQTWVLQHCAGFSYCSLTVAQGVLGEWDSRNMKLLLCQGKLIAWFVLSFSMGKKIVRHCSTFLQEWCLESSLSMKYIALPSLDCMNREFTVIRWCLLYHTVFMYLSSQQFGRNCC